MNNDSLRKTYDRIAEDWHDDHRGDSWWVDGTNAFVGFLEKGAWVLDAGCGGGTKSKYLLEHGLTVVSTDFSEKLIEIARREVPGAEFHVLDLWDVKSLSRKFDGIFLQAVLLHIPKVEALEFLRTLVSVLKPGGYLYVAVKEQRESEPEERMVKEDDYGYSYERFFSFYLPEELRGHFESIGLETVFEDVPNASHDTRWIQMIGKK